MFLSRICKIFATSVVFATFCFGQDSSNIKITPHGFSSAEWGQVVKGYDKNVGDIAHVSFARIYLGTGLKVKFNENTDFSGRLDVKAFNEFPRKANPGATRRFYYYFYLHQAELKHKFLDLLNIENFQLNVGGGYFPYKYNPNSRNLGEHLFRSTVYPQTLTTDFDMPWTRLAGLYSKFTYTAGKNLLGLDIVANLNTEWMAIGDLNLALLAKYNYSHFLEFGAGVQFASLVSTDGGATTPDNRYTRYLDGNDTTKNYTFKGTKIMGRISLDVKKIFSCPYFGENDLQIYSEATLLGVKNYGVALYSPIWYNSILERIPVMVGFNIPSFKIFDVLSIEGQWWGNRYPNSMEGVVIDGLPLPFLKTDNIDSTLYKKDNYKWSIFASKTFKKYYRISAQAASDHMRTFAWDYPRQDWEESLHGPKNWSYILKFGILF